MTHHRSTDHRIGFTIALGAIALLAGIALSQIPGTPMAGTAFAVATIAGSLLVVALHAYPRAEDAH
jgi:membrane associated rhomboid family serine protease